MGAGTEGRDKEGGVARCAEVGTTRLGIVGSETWQTFLRPQKSETHDKFLLH